MDPYRFSQATLEDTQEDELNAILGELSALQLSLDREIKQPSLLDVVPSTESKTGSGTQNENGKWALKKTRDDSKLEFNATFPNDIIKGISSVGGLNILFNCMNLI